MQWLESQNYAIVRTELDRVFRQEFDYATNQPNYCTAATPEVFKQQTIDRAAFIQEVYAGPGLFQPVSEIQATPTDLPRVANKQTTFIQDWANGIELSKDLFDDNMHQVWSNSVKEMALMARVTMDANAFKIYRGAFTTTLTADGQPFIGNHTLIKTGATYNNSVSGPLNSTTLRNAMIKLRQQPNQAGVVLGMMGETLLVPSALLVTALQITDSALITDSANNNINVFRSTFGYKVLSNPYLDAVAGGSDTAWFLLARNHSVTRLIRQGLQTSLRDWSVSNNRTYFYQANFREEVYVSDYVGAVGSTGV